MRYSNYNTRGNALSIRNYAEILPNARADPVHYIDRWFYGIAYCSIALDEKRDGEGRLIQITTDRPLAPISRKKVVIIRQMLSMFGNGSGNA